MIRVFSRYISAKAFVLMPLEMMLMIAALVCAVRIRFWASVEEFTAYVSAPGFMLQALVFVGTLQLCSYYCQLYTPGELRSARDRLIASGQAIGSGCLLLALIYFLAPTLLLGRGIFFISLALIPVLLTLSRLALDRIWTATIHERVLILGTGNLAVLVASELRKRNDLNAELVGLVNANGKAHADWGYAVLGSASELERIVEEHRIGRIIVALEDRRNALPTQELVRLRVKGLRVEDAHSVLAALTGRVWLETVKPSWFVFSDGFRRSALTLIVKRTLDLACGIVGLVLSLPIMLVVAVAIRLDSKGPIIYRQRRVGLRGRCFNVLKFRSMRQDAENGTGPQWATARDCRVTRVGRVLRKYRLDEVPQFVNVIRGEMSFVGPRPERPEFVQALQREIPYYDERHTVRPGVTGWAQVQYRYGSSTEDACRKLEYDLFYMKNMSLFFDCAIIVDTVGTLLSGRGT